MRRFEFAEGASNKFWEIEQDGSDLVIRWGRIGTQGQSQTKNFADAAKAASALDKLVSEKTGKGYVEAGAGVAAMPSAAADAAKDKKKNAAPAVPASAPASAVAVAAAIVAAPAPAVTAAPPPVPAPDVGAASLRLRSTTCRRCRASKALTPPWLAAGEPLDFDAAMKRLLQPDYQGKAGEPLPSRRFPGGVDDGETRRAWMLAKNAILQDKELDLAACDPALLPLLRETWGRLEKDRLDGSDESQALLLALGLRAGAARHRRQRRAASDRAAGSRGCVAAAGAGARLCGHAGKRLEGRA